jgi:hypothetical protein
VIPVPVAEVEVRVERILRSVQVLLSVLSWILTAKVAEEAVVPAPTITIALTLPSDNCMSMEEPVTVLAGEVTGAMEASPNACNFKSPMKVAGMNCSFILDFKDTQRSFIFSGLSILITH